MNRRQLIKSSIALIAAPFAWLAGPKATATTIDQKILVKNPNGVHRLIAASDWKELDMSDAPDNWQLTTEWAMIDDETTGTSMPYCKFGIYRKPMVQLTQQQLEDNCLSDVHFVYPFGV